MNLGIREIRGIPGIHVFRIQNAEYREADA
jgi:hypothetical protein